ncbi:MAG: GTPase Era [Methylotenera sp.]|nr:GTPase Era [Oligoflexia bacterium]
MKKSGFIAIAGRPNAGKSTLLNHVLGSKVSIVTPKAQTTRERVLGIFTEPQGQMIFIDTPGIHRAKEGGINEYMMAEVKEALKDVSAVWYIVDPASASKHEQPVLDLLRGVKAPVFILMNKMDLTGKTFAVSNIVNFENELQAACKELGIDVQGIHPISALKGKGIDPVLEASWNLLPEGEFYYPDEDQLSDRPTKYFVAEKVREQLFLQLGDEIPYCCAIEIDRFDEKVTPPRIEATIHVERDSQKGMVIGQGGAKIKAIGQAARAEVEEFLGQKVFLGLKVNVLKDWSRDAETLKRLGYVLPSDKPTQRSKKKNKPTQKTPLADTGARSGEKAGTAAPKVASQVTPKVSPKVTSTKRPA